MKTAKKIATSVWTWLVVLLLISLISYLLLDINLSGAEEIQVELIEQPELEHLVTTKGVIDVEGGLIKLSASTTGIFNSVSVKEGDQVTSGQTLAIQDDSGAVIKIENAELKLENTRLSLKQDELQYANIKRDAQRGKIQREQDAISEQQLERLLDTVKRTELSVISQKNAIAISTSAVEEARFQLSQLKLLAPVDGKVIKVNIAPGSGVSAQNVSTAIIIIPDNDRVIRVGINDVDIEMIYLNQPVEIKRLNNKDKSYQGRVTHISEVFSSVLNSGGGGGITPGANKKSSGLIEVVVNVGDIPMRLGQEVLVMFKNPDVGDVQQ